MLINSNIIQYSKETYMIFLLEEVASKLATAAMMGKEESIGGYNRAEYEQNNLHVDLQNFKHTDTLGLLIQI